MPQQTFLEKIIDDEQLNIATYFPWSSRKDSVDKDKYERYEEFLRSPANRGREAVVYVHVPYCLSICEYCHCDKLPIPKDRPLKDALEEYLTLLLHEITLYADMPYVRGLDIRYVHIGGGTPSLMSVEQTEHLIRSLWRVLELDDGVGLYFEGEVRSLKNREKMELLNSLNVQRVSFGVQSFDPTVRDLCNLKPRVNDLVEMVVLLKDLKMEANIDLIYGLPAQTADTVREDLRMAKRLGIASIDCYRNVVYPSLPQFQKYRHAYPEIFDEKNKMHLYSVIYEELCEAGYRPVTDEVFNLENARYSAIKQATAKCGEDRVDILGIGYGALSNLGGCCTRNGHGENYAHRLREDALPVARLYVETEEEQYTLMGVKGLGCGLKLSVRDRYYGAFRSKYGDVVDLLLKGGFAVEDDAYLALTKKGILHHSAVQLAFLSDEQKQRMKRFTCDNVWKG